MTIFVEILKMKVLILESNLAEANSFQQLMLTHCSEGAHFDVVTSFEKMKDLQRKNEYNLLFINIDTNADEVFAYISSEQNGQALIFVTSKTSNMMIEAHKHKIAGYLIKPFQSEQFAQVMARSKRAFQKCNSEEPEDYTHFKSLIDEGKINRIALTTLDGYVIVHYDDIVRCEANGNYTSVYFSDSSFLMLTKTLKHYASRLEQHGFFRVHKTHLVNLSYVRSYAKGKNSYIELTDGSNIEVSLRKKQALVEILSK